MKSALTILLSLLSLCLLATQVSGNQSGTWSAQNNPYEIIGDITVPSGLTLIVEPGVLVSALGNYQIIAQGNIIANGTDADSIKFVSGQVDQTALWKGIRLENTSVQSLFSFCLVELGQYGINSINSPVSITHCHFNKNQKGIQSYGIGSTNPATVLIGSNLIEFSQHNGILVAQNSNTTIVYNDITANGLTTQYYGAIQLSNQSAGGSNSPEIAHNHIHHNHKQGIIAWDVVSANAINPFVHDNLVENNLSGIYFRHSSGRLYNNIVINNFIPGDMNSGAGFMISGSTAMPYILENTVTGNYTGFYLTENANPIMGDALSDNMWAQGGNHIEGNIDANNVRHSVYCYSYTNSAITIKAENNYWDYSSATEIAGTIQDHNDDAALPTIDFDPWEENTVPIYLAGTVTMTNPPVPNATLELVSAQTGNVINTWTVTINTPFQVSVCHDSLVYIVAHTTDMIENHYYGAYGGTDNPTATQIVADVQFSIGDLPISTVIPNWYYRKIGAPQTINGHLSYPMKYGWFVYAPTQIFFLYRDNDFLKLSRIEAWLDGTYYAFSVDDPPIWLKTDNLDSDESWEQYTGATVQPPYPIYTHTTHAVANITTFKYGESSSYDLIQVGSNYDYQLYDYHDNLWVNCHMYGLNNGLTGKWRITPAAVEPDGTLFPLVQNNYWKSLPDYYMYDVPDYFGYKTADSLAFYWIPPHGDQFNHTYRIYDNNVLLTEVPNSVQKVTVSIPTDGMEHTYTLSVYYNSTDHFSPSSITLTFTADQDEVQPVNQLSVYPNPFNPAASHLTLKYDFPKSVETKVAVYNLKGQLVWNRLLEKGATELTWDGRDNNGKICASGLYQISLTNAKGHRIIRKLMLIR